MNINEANDISVTYQVQQDDYTRERNAMSAPLRPSYESELEARIAELEIAIKNYLAEYDSQIPDYNHKKVRLRMRLREVIKARPAP